MSGTIKTKKELMSNLLAQVDDCSLSNKIKINSLQETIKKVRQNK